VTQALSRRLDKLTRRLMAAMSEDVTARLCRLLLDFIDDDHQDSGDKGAPGRLGQRAS
jgi:hypothetical protein